MSGIAIGKDVQQCYESIVGGDKSVSWGVFSYEGQTELKLQASGADDLTEFPDEFSDGKLQYAFLRLLEPNSKLPKFVLVGWCGDGAPRKGVFQQHFSSVAQRLTGYHVQITARSEEDVSEQNMMKKVEDASGAKYSTSSSGSVFGPTTSKKPTTNSLVSQLKGQSSPSFSTRKPTQTEPRLPPSASIKPSVSRGPSYANKTTEDWDVPKTDIRGKLKSDPPPPSDATESRDAPVKSSYQPIGRPDINALRAEAQTDNPSLSAQPSGTSYKPVEVPKTGSLADRMSAFTNNSSTTQTSPSAPRKSSNPLASRFGGAIGGTKPAVPVSGSRESRAIGGLAKNFGSEDGKTPAQLWAERKARERGESIPEPVKEAPVKATTYDATDESSESRPDVSSMRDRFAASTIEDEAPAPKPVSLPSPVSVRAETPEPEPLDEDEEEVEDVSSSRMPPAPNMGSRPAAAKVVPQEPEEVEGEEEENIQAAHVKDPVFETAPVKNDFKSQLEKTIGGGGSGGPTAAATTIPQEEMNSNGAPKATALYEYEAQEENELSIQEGETITEIEMIDEGWWSGKNTAGETGLFPSNYVELIEDHDAPAAPAATHIASPATTQRGAGLCATALYEYEAAEEGEVGFAEGEMISEIQQIDEGWWQGKNTKGEEGLFPSNYVELID